MRIRLATALCAAAFLAAPGVSVAALFNLRASLESGYYVSGRVSVDPVTGLVTSEDATLSRNGVTLSVFGAPVSQGPFAPGGGVAPSYLFASPGPGGYLFVGAVPGPSLAGYAGGELCALAAAAGCAYSDLFKGGTTIANVIQGVLLPATNTVESYRLTGTFANGDDVTGTVVIDTTAGYVLDARATLFSHGVVIDEFFNPLTQFLFAPGGGVAPSFLVQSTGPAGVLLNLGIPGTALTDYAGGDLCATGTGLTCAFSNIFLTATLSSEAVTGSLVKVTAVAEPSTLPLLATGLVAIGLGLGRRWWTRASRS